MSYCSTTEVRRRAAAGAASGGTATTTALPEEELRDLIEQASRFFDLECGVDPGHFEPALYPVWESNHLYVVGDIITPTTRNSHIYRVTTAGTSGASEPVFPTGSGATVASGTAVFTEHGADVVATERVFYGDGSNFLRLDPYVSGTLNATIALPSGYTVPEFVERDGYLIRAEDGVLLPENPDYHAWSSQIGRQLYGWYRGVAITVTAIWGYSATPADVKLAVIELVLNLWRETDPANIKLLGIENQPIRERVPPRVEEVARRYRLKRKAMFV